ncbi:membrane protein insertase YidC [Qipengyuania sp. JC766]|uniref:membrane protein insertase YidC n=1 Tax=Qipengyuania sp. JC766 TaxID=3232139 RepID=UPI003458F9EE
MDNQRNLLLAVVLCGLILIGWDTATRFLYPDVTGTTQADRVDDPAQRAQVRQADGTAPAGTAAVPAGDIEGTTTVVPVTLDGALGAAGRVPIDAPEVSGSLNSVGARIDDITLKTHRQEVEKDSGPIRLFAPQGTDVQQFAKFGFLVDGQRIADDTQWQVDGDRLTQETPVTLRYRSDGGQSFAIRFEIDEHYMITATQTAANTGQGAMVVQPFAYVARTSTTASADQWLVHSGPIGAFGGSVDFSNDYDDVQEAGQVTPEGNVDWLGFTDIYWLSTLIPQDGAAVDGEFTSLGNDLYRADLVYEPVTVAAGQQVTRTTRLFAGAKESAILSQYEAAGVTKFDNSIDWGWFSVLAKPIWWLLTHLFDLVKNFGVAIILMTLLIRLVLFPIAQKQFSSMAAMRAIQPKMKAVQEKYKDDKQKQQQEIMALYKKEKVNPLAGCLPLLIQIPIFFALYKVLYLAIEMRHQPFALWIRDLSAPDPAHILNLFGLLPFEVPGLLAIGPLAVLLGISMWLTFRLNPTSMDPMQQQIFAIMPWILMFVMAPFAAGLLIYWITNNVLTLTQQSYLYSRHPQLKAQAAKNKEDRERAKEREAKGA